MDRLSPLAFDTLERLAGALQGSSDLSYGLTMGRVLVPVEGPEELAEELIAAAMESDSRVKRANRKLASRDPMETGMDGNGRITIGGRACCWEHVSRLSADIERLPIFSEHQCQGCGTVYRVDVGRLG